MNDASAAIREYMGRKIWEMENLQDSSAVKAKLRRGVGKEVYDAPESWGIVLSGIPEQMLGKGRGDRFEPSREERALYSALTLYALHAQGNSGVDVKGQSFGTACSKLISETKGNRDAIRRRFDALASSGSMDELLHHSRGMITMMKTAVPVVGLDYCGFAVDLYSMQFDGGMQKILFKWAQDFFSNTNQTY